jgi:hypothetical protein
MCVLMIREVPCQIYNSLVLRADNTACLRFEYRLPSNTCPWGVQRLPHTGSVCERRSILDTRKVACRLKHAVLSVAVLTCVYVCVWQDLCSARLCHAFPNRVLVGTATATLPAP